MRRNFQKDIDINCFVWRFFFGFLMEQKLSFSMQTLRKNLVDIQGKRR